MERSQRMRIYLDHNVFIKCLDGEIDKKMFRDIHNMEFVYGPAHIQSR